MKTRSGRTTFLLAISLFAGVLLQSRPAGAAAKMALRVAYSSISGTAIVPFIALDKGLFAEYGLDVELIYVAGSQAMQSLRMARTRRSFESELAQPQ